MKRSSSALNNSAKKMCLEEESTSDVSSVNMHIPEHFFQLSNNYFVVVSDFSDVITIHIRKFWRNKYGRLIPTKMGVTLSPILWQSLTKKLDYLNPSCLSSKSEIIDEELMISTVSIEDTPHIILQRYFQRKDFVRVFTPTICLLSDSEWQTLRNIHKDVTTDIIRELFCKIFPKMILKEADQQMSPSANPSEMGNDDAEMVLTTSMVELLKCHLEASINNVFECIGCEENFGNQLGHDCMTMNRDRKLRRYGNVAIFSMDLELLAQEFVQQNVQIISYVTKGFFNNLDMSRLIENAKELYIASDPCPDLMF